jgi:mono/diheme cytochrome c family protein
MTTMRTMEKKLTWSFLAAALALAACNSEAERTAVVDSVTGGPRHPAKADPKDLVALGERLVARGACDDCHTPALGMGPDGKPIRDLAHRLSGHPESLLMPPAPLLPPGPWVATVSGTMTAWSGPWGTSFTANLTPDVETGLGSWTSEDFIAMVRTGRHMGKGRPVLPPMPIEVLVKYTDQELAAVFAYLKTLPPVKNHVPSPIEPGAKAAMAAPAAGATALSRR